MDNKNTNFNNNNKPNAYDMINMLYIGLNGIATGHSIRIIRKLINNHGDDKNAILDLLLSLGVMAYTAKRAYDIYKKNQNQR